MNKNNYIVTLVLSFLSIFSAYAGIVDTLYYDANWKGVESPQLATYYRVLYYPNDPKMPKQVRDYYKSGQLQAEGNFLSIDPYDDSKSVFDGEMKSYYENGKLGGIRTYSGGKLSGKMILFYPNGNYKTYAEFNKGMLVGNLLQYSEDGTVMTETPYLNNIEGKVFSKYVNKENVGKFYVSDGSPVLLTPSSSNLIKELRDGKPAQTYVMNGIKLSALMQEVKDYGKYYRIFILLANYTNTNIIFDTSNISAKLMSGSKKEKIAKIYTADEYIKKINKKTALAKWYHNTNERMNAAQSGETTVTSQINSKSTGANTSNGTASAHNSSTNAYGNYTSNTTTYGNLTGTISTTVKDNSAAYDAQQIATKNIQEYNQKLEEMKQKHSSDYIHYSSIRPYDYIFGYVNIDKENGEELEVSIIVNGIAYPFTFKL